MPKTFTQYNRWDKGLNTKFDELDVDRTSLVASSHWDVSKPGKIRTVNKRRGDNIFSVSGSYDNGNSGQYLPLQHGVGSLLVTADYAIGAAPYAGSFNADGEQHLFFGSDDGDISVFDGLSAIRKGVFNYGTTSGAHECAMIWFEGVLRVSDKNNHSTGRTVWVGRIARTRFNSTDNWNTKDHWIAEQAGLDEPTTSISNGVGYGIVFLKSSAVTPNTKGEAPNLSLQITSNSTTGTWQATSYEFGMTYMYQGGQESKIVICKMYDHANTNEVTYFDLPTQQHWSGIKIRAQNGSGGGEDFDQRVTGCRWYVRKQGTGKRWRLFVDADFTKGGRINTFDNHNSAWARNSAGINSMAEITQIKSPSIETYESLNGFTNSEFAVSFKDNGQTWGDATAINRRVFYTGVYYKDEDNNSKALHDRIFYSQPGRPDTIPTSNWVDLGINDGDVFIGLTSFANRILAFKRNTIYILNVTNPSPMGWALENVIENNGANSKSSICRTRYGVVWANTNGCYMWNGQGLPTELTTPIDVPGTWSSDFTGCNISVGYDSISQQLVVSKTALSNSAVTDVDSLCYIYDMATKSWIRGTEMYWRHSNFMNNQDGELCWVSHLNGGTQTNNTFNLEKWFTASGNTSGLNPSFTMKSDNFDSPGILKKFYSVLATIKTEGAADVKISFNGGNTVTLSALDLDKPTVKRFDLSTPVTSEKMQLKFDVVSTGGNYVEINDIALEYRQLRKRPDG